MYVDDRGHRYALDQIEPSTKQLHGEKQSLQFLNTWNGRQTPGVDDAGGDPRPHRLHIVLQ